MERMGNSLVVRTVVLAAIVVGLVVLGQGEAAAQNLLTNPGFDGDLSGWTTGERVTFDPNLDATGMPGSGSAQVDAHPEASTGFLQCLPATQGASYAWGGEYFGPAGAGVDFGILLVFFAGPDCTGGGLGLEALQATGGTTGAWEPLSSADMFPDGVVAPDGTESIGLQVSVSAGFTLTNFDDLFVTVAGEGPGQGVVIVVKQTVGGDGTFEFTSDLPGNASFSITTSGGSGPHVTTTVDPDTYHIAEVESDGWTLVTTSCNNGDDPAEVTVGPEEAVTCVFVNQAVEVVPALPGVGAIALMLLLATSATWALRRARGAHAMWIAMVGLLLANLPGAALAANPATEPAGGESPRALVARMNAAQAEGDFGTIVNCIEPKGRTELTAGLLAGTVMMVAFSGAFGEMAGTMAEGLGEAVTGEEPSAEQQRAIEAGQEAAAQRVEELNRRLATILQEHGLPDLTDENAPLPEGGPEELLAKIDQGALVNDLLELMASLGGDQGGNPAGELPVPKEVTGYRIDGDRAEASAGEEPVHFVRIDGRWFLEVPEVDNNAE